MEVAEAFDISADEYLFFGGYPGALTEMAASGQLSAWRDHIRKAKLTPTFDRDIMGLTRVDKPALMRQFANLACHYSGQLISFRKLIGRLQDGCHVSTAARYLNLLSNAGPVTDLNRYTPAPHGGRKTSPKLNVFSTSLMTAQSGYTMEEAKSDRPFWGRIVESAVGAHLLNTLSMGARLHYWRDPPLEVDFVVLRGPHLLGIEVKNGRPRDTPGLRPFAERDSHARTMVVGSGGDPISEFLSLTAMEWLEEA